MNKDLKTIQEEAREALIRLCDLHAIAALADSKNDLTPVRDAFLDKFIARVYEAGGDDRELRRYIVMEQCAAEGWDFDRFLGTYAATIAPLLGSRPSPTPTEN